MKTVEKDPDPEVPAKAKSRTYSAAYKARILAEYETLDKAGKGALLRREGLYTSLISAWRDQRDKGALEAMKASRPGPKVDATKAELVRLRARVSDLEDKLATAEELIDAQGKASALLQQMRRKSADPKS